MSLIERSRRTREALEKEHGLFTFFALVRREDISDKFDLVVSAPWLSAGREGIQLVADKLTVNEDGDDPDWWRQFGRIAVLEPNSPFIVQAMRRQKEEERFRREFIYEVDLP